MKNISLLLTTTIFLIVFAIPVIADSYEPDDVYTQANWVAVDGTKYAHALQQVNDSDWMKFNATVGARYLIETYDLSSPVDRSDTWAILYNSGLSYVADNDDISGGGGHKNLTLRRSRLDWTATSTGMFYVLVRHWDEDDSAGGTYNFSITELPVVSVSVVEPADDYEIPRYSSFNFTVNVSCAGIDCQDITTYLDPQSPNVPGNFPQGNAYGYDLDLRSSIEDVGEDEWIDVVIVFSDEEASSGVSAKKVKDKKDERKNKIKAKQDDVLDKFSGGKGGYSTASNDKFITKHRYALVNAMSGKITKAGLEALENDPLVESVQLDYMMEETLSASVPLVNADDVWGMQVSGTNITGDGETICVVDSGITYTHPDFGSCGSTSDINDGSCPKVIGGFDLVNNDNDPTDDRGHGSHCAGIAASQSTGYTGVAPGAKLVAVKIFDSEGSSPSSRTIAGVDWCIDHADEYNISVISMSLGCSGESCVHYQSYCDDDSTAKAIDYANELGISVVVASGNDGWDDGVPRPACARGAFTVGSVTKSDVVASSSNSGNLLDIFAPGVSIMATSYTGGWTSKSGTSMATPHVSGAIALFNQYYKLKYGVSPSSDTVKARLTSVGPLITDSGASITRPRLDIQAGLAKGVIPMNSGSPFYTITQNPNVTTIAAGDSILLTWVVNTTGQVGTDWEFFTFTEIDNTNEEYISEKINISITAPIINVNYSNFDHGLGTTNLSEIGDLTSVPDMVLATSLGRIWWGGNLNVIGQDLDSRISISRGFVKVDSSNLHSSFNGTARITFENVGCNRCGGLYVFYSPTETTKEGVLANGEPCGEMVGAGTCTAFSCANDDCSFNVTQFSGYAYGADSNLTINDSAEGSYVENDTAATFYAYYINETNGAPITGATCTVDFDDGSGSQSMSYSTDHYEYTKSAGFSSAGTHDWNVSCTHASFDNLFAEDTISVQSPGGPVGVPEFSTWTLIIGLMVIVGGFMAMKRE